MVPPYAPGSLKGLGFSVSLQDVGMSQVCLDSWMWCPPSIPAWAQLRRRPLELPSHSVLSASPSETVDHPRNVDSDPQPKTQRQMCAMCPGGTGALSNAERLPCGGHGLSCPRTTAFGNLHCFSPHSSPGGDPASSLR